ncbi:MAG: integration host factor subunit alpha, partial [Candidatus Thioglobus sp. MED-G23]
MGNTITKADLANTLFDELGLNKREAKEFVELFFEKIRQALETGETVKLS